ncbi:malonyl-CoA/methylmalonyl-CoA synthetase [Rhodovulum imhoffii]|uniref:Malonyl-CoA/methylmalonyl-CoA synthetase n=1 Tax=Rhodovulum imhoffii TaxID=365340 RepID=A0A2T5BNY9_9RHOB|nr:malonyl-CoA synthase [Rhodovulum imhoffii]MBK5932549.1 malonyl-CoA synthase [Rhodovulum imhoffii]PTN00690.1 malonyl-CoA/methylmalonyl-CoA synthetase [Rhodovulum imhoffii]
MTNPLFDTLFGCHAENHRPFLHLPGGRSLSYDAFLKQAARFAHALGALGLVQGDRLAMQVEKSPHALAVYAACVQAGVILLPLNTAYTDEELAYFLENSGARLFLCDGARADTLSEVAKATGCRLAVLNADGTGSFAIAAQDKPDRFETVPRTHDDLAAFLYTSGTTGRSKGAMLTQENLLSNARVLAQYWRFSENDVLLHALPLFHTHGLFVATNTVLASGGAMLLLPGFDTEAVLNALPHTTVMMGVPTYYTRLLNEPRFTADLVAHMRLFTSGSAPMLTQTHHLFEDRTGQKILERYGMTETNMTTSNPYDGARRPGTVGVPLPGVEVKITAPDGTSLPKGQIGMIEVRGPNVFRGYWQMPQKTREELRENGFFITGDLGRIDEDGYLQIVGRSKDLVITGGYNVYPKEVEQILDDQPGVLESAVIGVPHPDYGEAVLAVLVPRAGEVPDLALIGAGLRTRLAGFKQPRKMVLAESLPRNTMGKVQKNVLRTAYKDVFQNG